MNWQQSDNLVVDLSEEGAIDQIRLDIDSGDESLVKG